MALHLIGKVVDIASPKQGKLKARKNEHFQLIDKDGKATQVSVIGVYEDELVITELGRKKESYLAQTAKRFEILKRALVAAGIFNLFSRK
jgi:hypothetical protein